MLVIIVLSGNSLFLWRGVPLMHSSRWVLVSPVLCEPLQRPSPYISGWCSELQAVLCNRLPFSYFSLPPFSGYQLAKSLPEAILLFLMLLPVPLHHEQFPLSKLSV